MANMARIFRCKAPMEKGLDVEEKFVDEHTLTTSISRIRGKIEAEGDTYIKTIYGIGYQWTGGERSRSSSTLRRLSWRMLYSRERR